MQTTDKKFCLTKILAATNRVLWCIFKNQRIQRVSGSCVRTRSEDVLSLDFKCDSLYELALELFSVSIFPMTHFLKIIFTCLWRSVATEPTLILLRILDANRLDVMFRTAVILVLSKVSCNRRNLC